MELFSSKAQPDRFPYRVGAVRVAYEGTLNGEHTVYDPRPFDPVMHNDPNPILIRFRKWIDGEDIGDQFWVDYWVTAFDEFDTFGGFITWDYADHPLHVLITATDAQSAHARRVLTRLANLSR